MIAVIARRPNGSTKMLSGESGGYDLMTRFLCASCFRLTVAAVVVAIWAANSAQSAIVLFNDDVSQRPADQPWLTYFDDGAISGGTATESTVPGVGVRLATDDAVSAGYSNYLPSLTLKNPAFPVLDRHQGYTLNFELQMHSESHDLAGNRAGFSAIVLGNDSRGIELGFWSDRVWAQADLPLFTRAEEALFNTTSAEVEYRLSVFGNSYSLFANNAPLLSGSLRDYSAFGLPPYTLSNFLFLGDNTSSAGADFTLGTVELASVPEPAGLSLLAGVAVLWMVRRKTSRPAAQSLAP